MENVSVPGFQYFMTSFLQVLKDGSTKHIRTIIDDVIKLEKLTPEQCAVKLPTQNVTQVVNRIAWVREGSAWGASSLLFYHDICQVIIFLVNEYKY